MDVKGQLKQWLHATGKDIAKAVGAHVKERGIKYAKDQLGLGISAQMHNKKLEMSGDGVSNWFKESGLEIGRIVGDHLKEQFKSMAVSKAKEFLGQGLRDQLKESATAVGKTSLLSGLSQLHSIKNAASAKQASRNVGSSAMTEGKKQLASLISKRFGGAGTPEQAVKVCAYNVSELRKTITRFRAKLRGLSHEDFLDIHAHRIVKPEHVQLYRNDLRLSAAKSKMTKKRKAAKRREVMQALHPAVSKMSRQKAVEYIYGIARELDIDWEPFFDDATQKAKISKKCERMMGPGLVKAPVKRAKIARAPSAYNLFMKSKLDDTTWMPNIPYSGKHGRFARAAHLWKKEKSTRAVEQETKAASAEFRKRHKKKVPKKKQPLPTQDEAFAAVFYKDLVK